MAEERVSAELRRLVVERARECCEYCRSQARFAMQAFSVEHIEPRRLEGVTSGDNLALSCQGCNLAKIDKETSIDPKTDDEVPPFQPAQAGVERAFSLGR